MSDRGSRAKPDKLTGFANRDRSPSHHYECLVQLSSHATAIDARSIDDTVRVVDGATAAGGRTVAVVEIGILLRKGGVLDSLKAKDISIAAHDL